MNIYELLDIFNKHDHTKWFKKSYKITGHWEVKKENDTVVIVLHENFKTSNGPDLKLILSPKEEVEINGENAMENAYSFGIMKSNKGKQIYQLPKEVNLEDYKTLLIHCEKFSVLWGGTYLDGRLENR